VVFVDQRFTKGPYGRASLTKLIDLCMLLSHACQGICGIVTYLHRMY
jgi:hypothetical protein